MKASILVLAGDGIGPEVTAEGTRVLRAVGAKFGHTFTLTDGLLGGIAIDRTGTPIPAETLALAHASDAVLLGAVGGPKWDNPSGDVRPEQGLFAIRKELGLYANLRPVTVHPKLMNASPIRPEILKGVDLLVVRELIGGIYFGEKKREADWASDVCAYSGDEVRRVVRRACELARGRRKKLTSVDKANVLESSRLWRRVTDELVRREYPDLQLEHVLVDACSMYLARRPASFDVIVTENMFGDILTDEASVLAGSMGLLPSASLGDGPRGLYEPIHGSAPDIAGRGIANPYATILSVAMLLRYSLGLEKEAVAVEAAVSRAIDRGVLTADVVPAGAFAATTLQAGQAVVEAL
ncbi:MAG: 3-isopropylmalate dehydrogenase [Polyangia bacterium]